MFSQILRFNIRIIFLFSETIYYPVYLVATIIGLYGSRFGFINSLLYLFCCYLMVSSFVFCILYNYENPKKRLYSLVGKEFADKYSLQSFFIPLLLVCTFIVPILLEYYTFSYQLYLYKEIMAALQDAYRTLFHALGGEFGDFAHEGKIAKPVRDPNLTMIYREMLRYKRPDCGMVVGFLRKIGL